ncbi:Protein kinase-like domain protein [Niveomyces insectorum RCEF 264]|uniref:Protein kinase-like domain protein n=1 Tax=Niveomyces insectorum RCEF 264 TaxID=1081102 RepID=A0A167VHT9_9HYPO|nr:Protein kinase-like domain protein [Niveomyces insectorum RCEF 264]
MHLSPDFQHDDDWDVVSPVVRLASPLLRSPDSSSRCVTTGADALASHCGPFPDQKHSYLAAGHSIAIGPMPLGFGLSQFDYRVLLSLQGLHPQSAHPQTSTLVRPFDREETRIAYETGNAFCFSIGRTLHHLTLADIEALEELPGSSGRRQSSAYRLGRDHVIKVSPHHGVLYEARVLAYIEGQCPGIPVPRVFGTCHLRDSAGRNRYCVLMEYIDGVRADEALCDWNADEIGTFMDAVRALQQALTTRTGRRIQAINVNEDSEMGNTRVSDDDADGTSNQQVQDELFDHIWQDMARGPFDTEAAFVASIGVALRRRGADARRLELVSSMIAHLPAPASTMVESPETTSRTTVNTADGDTQGTRFTLQHANLTPENILVRRTACSSAPEIVGVLGWGQSGFYPPWWEMAKMAASEDKLMVDLAASDAAFPRYSQQVSVMLHVRDIIY